MNEEEIKEEKKRKKKIKEEREEEGKIEEGEEGEKGEEEIKEGWKPKTQLGIAVKKGQIKNIDEIFEKGIKIMEPEIVDNLLQLKTDFLRIGQAKGKFGGGKRRIWKQTQKKTAEGNVPTFACMAVVGDENGHIGLGYGKARETLSAREKALREARLNIIAIKRGCGSFDCKCIEHHSLPFKVEGKIGSVKIVLIPAPRGTGIVASEEIKKMLKLAGIQDIYSKTFGQTRTTINLAKACFEALKKTRR